MVVASDMRQLMSQDRSKLIRGKRGEGGYRDENHRRDPADYHRGLSQATAKQAYGSSDAEFLLE